VSGFCTFEFRRSTAEREKEMRYAVVFCSNEALTASYLSDRMHSYLQSSSAPDHVIMLTHKYSRNALVGLTDNDEFIARLPGRLRAEAPLPVTCAYFDETGNILKLDPERQEDTAHDRKLGPLAGILVRQGLFCIFDRRNGLLPSSPLYHYVKPSEKHTAEFIRTAEVLVDGGEVDFLASCLLPHLLATTRYIYCDSASIAVVGYAVAKLRRCHAGQFRFPVVESFGSYRLVDQYSFLNPSESLFLISASTSGDLARRLISKKAVPSDRIVTLFYLGKRSYDGHVLLDLTHDARRNPKGYPKIEGYQSDDCPFCRDESCPIPLSGDQFLPLSTRVDSIRLRIADAPKWLSGFLRKTEGKKIIRCHHGSGLRDRVHEQFFDISPTFVKRSGRSHTFADNVRKALTQSIPASLERIIFIDDPISQKLAQLVKREFSELQRRSVRLLNSQTVIRRPAKHRLSTGTTMVVAGCILTGRSLMELSQVLRTIQQNASIAFFIGLARCETKEIFEEIETNVTFTRDRAQRFAFHCVETVYIPDSTNFRQSIWTNEIHFLRRLKKYLVAANSRRVAAIDQRIEQLNSSLRVGSGMTSDLFWPDGAEQPLQLRPNFSFFDFQSPSTATQAEIFFVMSSILHQLRINPPGTRRLIQGEHQRTLIAPNSFYQFNDGIVQAALLRAARRAELDYRVDESQSAAMREVVNSIFSAWNRPRGEAATEFLVMIGMGQLRLVEYDTRALVEDFLDRLPANTLRHDICRFILEQGID
jgi:hypothetical protein